VKNVQPKYNQILRREAVARRVGLSIPSIYRLIEEGRFPRPVPLSTQARGWLESEIEAWIQGRIAERDEAAA
jgi:prophage regulatory protein